MKLSFQITVKVSAITIRKVDFQNIRRAIKELGYHIRNVWIDVAEAELNRATGQYIAAIQKDDAINLSKDGFSVRVINTAPHAGVIEIGHFAYRLPEKINWSNTKGKIKRTKDGTPYLTIPFQHFTPVEGIGDQGATYRHVKQQMPHEIYEYARRLTRSLDVRTPKGGTKTEWGGRLTKETSFPEVHQGTPAGRFMTAAFYGGGKGMKPFVSKMPHWAASKYAGMVKTGAQKHTRYLTFRTLTPNSSGWQIPAKAGKHIAEKVRKKVESDVVRAIQAALYKDVSDSIQISG